MALNYHLLFKVLLVGDPEVGKAAILHQSGNESSCPSTVGVNFLKRTLELGKCCVHLWSVLFNLVHKFASTGVRTYTYFLSHSTAIINILFNLSFRTVRKT